MVPTVLRLRSGRRLVVALMLLAPVQACHRSSPAAGCGDTVTEIDERSAPEAQATSDDLEVWAMFFATWDMPPGQRPRVPVGEDIKIVFRATGDGAVTFSAAGPDGAVLAPSWGPELHTGSNWDRPGDEWGTGWTVPAAGCWTIEVERGDGTATLALDAFT